MATQSYEQLISGANKIRQNELPESNTAALVGEQLLQMVNKQQEESRERVKGITEYNVSVHHPTSGTDGTNRYTLETAIVQVPPELRNIGLKVAFINSEGKVESCMEFLRICVEQNFMNVVISIKASNTVIMVRTVRLLVEQMEKENMAFPLHLGVTEAGDGEDGRIKSALGIGALLCDGLGDTIRVSLSEAPEAEIPVARKLVDYVLKREGHPYIPATEAPEFNYTHPSRRETVAVGNIGGDQLPVVISARLNNDLEVSEQFKPDYLYCGQHLPENRRADIGYIVDACAWDGSEHTYPAFNYQQLIELHHHPAKMKFLFTSYLGLNEEVMACLRLHPEVVIVAQSNHYNRLGEFRALAHQLMNQGLKNP